MTEVESDSVLAQVVRVTSIQPIDGADRIEVATVLGWQVVVGKGEFQVGELAIYFSIGGVLDKNNVNTAFLEGKVLKTKKIRGAISQGLLGKLEWVNSYGVDSSTLVEDQDITALMRVKKWVASDEADLYDSANSNGKTPFPPIVPKTCEPRVQDCHKKIAGLKDQQIIISQKYDGTSATYVMHGDTFMVCNRNNTLNSVVHRNRADTKHYLDMAELYDLERKMKAYNRNIAIQGEIIGPKINGNKHGLNSNEYYVFNIYDLDKHSYVDYDEFARITADLGLKTVKLVYRGTMKDEWLSTSALLKLAAEQRYDTGRMCEGIVVKSDTGSGHERTSFKVISNGYLLKYGL